MHFLIKTFHKTNLKCLIATSSEDFNWVIYWKPKYYMLFEPTYLFFYVIPSSFISEIIGETAY